MLCILMGTILLPKQHSNLKNVPLLLAVFLEFVTSTRKYYNQSCLFVRLVGLFVNIGVPTCQAVCHVYCVWVVHTHTGNAQSHAAVRDVQKICPCQYVLQLI